MEKLSFFRPTAAPATLAVVAAALLSSCDSVRGEIVGAGFTETTPSAMATETRFPNTDAGIEACHVSVATFDLHASDGVETYVDDSPTYPVGEGCAGTGRGAPYPENFAFGNHFVTAEDRFGSEVVLDSTPAELWGDVDTVEVEVETGFGNTLTASFEVVCDSGTELCELSEVVEE